jgi:flagellar basal body-associated protein FliL
MAENDEGVEKKEEAGSGKKSSNLFVVIFGLAVMLIAPAASYIVVRTTLAPREPKVPKVERDAAGTPARFAVNKLNVNVAETRMTRVLRLEAHLILSDDKLLTYLETIRPVIQDRVMAAAGRRTLDQLERHEDRDALKRDIASEINTMIRDRAAGSVLDVVFSEFLIQ